MVAPAKPKVSELRKFGLLLFVVFAVVFGTVLPLLKGEILRWQFWVIGLPFGILAMTAPQLLARPLKVWMLVGEVLGAINARIILGLVFFALVVPIGFIRRIAFRSHAARLGFDPALLTYRQVRQAESPRNHMGRPF